MFKVVIAGGRYYQLSRDDYFLLDRIHGERPFTHVLCGGAGGADNGGKVWAESRNVPVEMFPAEWHRFGKKAGPKRNRQMAEAADAVILFPGGAGTASMRREALRVGCELLYDAEG